MDVELILHILTNSILIAPSYIFIIIVSVFGRYNNSNRGEQLAYTHAKQRFLIVSSNYNYCSILTVCIRTSYMECIRVRKRCLTLHRRPCVFSLSLSPVNSRCIIAAIIQDSTSLFSPSCMQQSGGYQTEISSTLTTGRK